MDRIRSKDRTVLEAFAEFDPSKTPGPSPAASFPLPVRSLAVSTAPDGSQTLIYLGTKFGKVFLLSSGPPALPASSPGRSGAGGDALDSLGPDAPSIGDVEFLRSASVGITPVDAVHVLAEIGRLLVLSDGSLFLLDLLLLQPARKLGFVKGVTALSKRLICTDSASSNPLGDAASRSELSRPGQRFLQKLSSGNRANGVRPRASESQREGEVSCFIAVAAGKKMVLLELLLLDSIGRDVTEYGGVSLVSKEIQGCDGVRTMAWLDDSIIVGTIEGYTLFATGTGQSTPILSLPESSGPPQLKLLCRSKEALLLVDNVGIVVNALGQPVGGSLIFQSAPVSIAEIPPYIVVSGDVWIDFHRKKTGICVQSLSLAKGGVGPCIVGNDDWASGEVVVAATPYKVICFHKVSAEEQLKDLLRKKYFKEALYLVEELESEGDISKEMLSFVHAQVGFLLLFDLHFEDAVNHFLLSETMQPSEIFPFIMRDPNRWSILVPRNRYWGLHPPPVPLEEVVENGLMAIQRAIFLRKAGIDTAADEEFLMNPPSKADLLESAIKNIIRYLRASRDKELNPSVREGVDTLLMYLYRALNDVDDMEQLASSQNSCVVLKGHCQKAA